MQPKHVNSTKEQKVNKLADPMGSSVSTRDLNDLLRCQGRGGKIVMTQSVHHLPDDVRSEVFSRIRSFDAFTPDNDPYGEHDFGEIEVGDLRVMFKIDYYDKSERFHSSDEADASVTSRVMTVMLSDEY